MNNLNNLLDDDRISEYEPKKLSFDEWQANEFVAVEITANTGRAEESRTLKRDLKSYEDYESFRKEIHESIYPYITNEQFLTKEKSLPGLLTFENAKNEFENFDNSYLKLSKFPRFSEAVKIRVHDSVVLSADTGAGKSSLAINFLDDLNNDYPVIYFNLEMDSLTILQRLVSIHTENLWLDDIENYKNDPNISIRVKKALQEITNRKPVQILKGVYTLEKIEKTIIDSTQGREEPTIVIIDHSLLVTTENKTMGRYERFTYISERLRRISREQNIIMIVLLQQNRSGKADTNEKPTNSSLKESGSWENDATLITFLWYDQEEQCKKLIVTKSRRGGDGTEIKLDYNKKTQQYKEAKEQTSTTNQSKVNFSLGL